MLADRLEGRLPNGSALLPLRDGMLQRIMDGSTADRFPITPQRLVADVRKVTALNCPRACRPTSSLTASQSPPISQWPVRVDIGSVVRAALGDMPTGLGVATGRARFAFDLSEVSELQSGEINVRSTTDPSWVPLFMIAGGVVCDIGAPTASHAAIVRRELGVPCVVSVRDACRRIPNGILIEIDGRSSTVSVIEG